MQGHYTIVELWGFRVPPTHNSQERLGQHIPDMTPMKRVVALVQKNNGRLFPPKLLSIGRTNG
jgi:hypothetical protein